MLFARLDSIFRAGVCVVVHYRNTPLYKASRDWNLQGAVIASVSLLVSNLERLWHPAPLFFCLPIYQPCLTCRQWTHQKISILGCSCKV